MFHFPCGKERERNRRAYLSFGCSSPVKTSPRVAARPAAAARKERKAAEGRKRNWAVLGRKAAQGSIYFSIGVAF